VRTSVGVVAYEGDRGSSGDRLALNGQLLSDAANPPTNVFNSSVSFQGTNTLTQRIPAYVNALGFDSDRSSRTASSQTARRARRSQHPPHSTST
jgi:hypothetical protein